MDAEYDLMYTVVTLNGKGFTFFSDDMCEIDGTYIFSEEGETVAEFKKDAIAGYFITRVYYEDEEYGEENE